MGLATYFLKGQVGRRHPEILQIHADLGTAVPGHEPSQSPARLEGSRLAHRLALTIPDDLAVSAALDPPLLTDSQGDLAGQGLVSGVQAHVKGNEDVAGPDGGDPDTRLEHDRAEIGCPLRGGQLFRQTLVFATPDVSQAAVTGVCGGAIKVDGNRQLPSDPLPHLPGQPDTLFQGNPREGHKGADIGGTQAGMRAVVAAHINQLGRPGDGLKGSLTYWLRLPYESHHRPVGIGAGIHVQQPYPVNAGNGLRKVLDHPLIPPFGEVGYALNQLHYGPEASDNRYLSNRITRMRRIR